MADDSVANVQNAKSKDYYSIQTETHMSQLLIIYRFKKRTKPTQVNASTKTRTFMWLLNFRSASTRTR